MTIRGLVSLLEQIVLDYLVEENIAAHRIPNAPGVYVSEKKLASIGLAMKRGCSYHGLSLNVCMDLAPFTLIHPCGHQGLEVTQVSALEPAGRGSLLGDQVSEISQISERLRFYFSKRWEAFS